MSCISETYKALLFDKDGTLFDFRGTWDRWAAELLPDLCDHDDRLTQDLADALNFDLENSAFRANSLVIAGTNREVAQAIARVLKRSDVETLESQLATRAAAASLQPVIPLAPFLQSLKAAGYKLGVMTNDAESSALAHLEKAGIERYFDFICGSDSGFGAKPDPEPLLAFCTHVQVDPFHTAMMGDSTHDLQAARAAGMTAVGLLTGVARAAELAPHADVVLNDIGELPVWLSEKSLRK